MRYLIGIDDTDNLESRGTGFRARQLGERLAHDGIANVEAITRHQLLVDPRIPYTSHNSSCCLVIELCTGGTNANVETSVCADDDASASVSASAELERIVALEADSQMNNTGDVVRRKPTNVDVLIEFCREFLLNESADGSDAGLCIVSWDNITSEVCEFGSAAKKQVLHKADALSLAGKHDIFIEGLTGDGGGVIGSLAAVGLRFVGNDGRVLWLQGLRELEGCYSAERLYSTIPINDIASLSGTRLDGDVIIDIGTWARPIMRNGKTVFLVEEVEDESNKWRIAPKEIIKQYSD
jgi:tRNA(Ile2) C34 agmatinyltransferase TiaS